MSITEPPVEDRAEDRRENPAAEPGSLLSSLQAKRREIVRQGAREECKLVPMWEGALRVRYRYPEDGSDSIIRAGARIQKAQPSEQRDIACDILIACWHTIEGRQPDGDWEPLEPDIESLKPTTRLANLLQIDVPEGVKSPARHIVRHVFSPKAEETGVFEGDVSLVQQAGEIVQWLGGVDKDADEELRGE